MTPPHIVLAAANVSIDASRRIVDLLASRPVDAELMAEVLQIAHEADVKVRALLPTPASPDLGTLNNGEPVRTPPQQVWRVVDGVTALWWFWPDTDSFGAMVGKHEHPAYAHAGALQPAPDPTRWIRALRGPAPSTAPTDRRLQVLARLVDVAGAAVGLENFVASTRAEYPDVFADLDEHLALVRTDLLSRTFGEALAERLDERMEQLCVPASTDTASAGPDFTIEDFEDAVRALESNATTPPAVVASPNVARLAGALDALAPGWSVDEPLDPSLWAQSLDRAQVAALAGERPSLVVQTEPREARWLRDLVEEDDSAELARLRKIERCAQGVFPRMEAVRRGGPIADVNQAQSELHWHLRDLCDLVKSETAPPSETERIAAHVATVAPGYRERARAWLDAEHTDMVEDLAALMATVSAECCS